MTLFERSLTAATFALSAIAMVIMLSAVAQANTPAATPARMIASTAQPCNADVREFLADDLANLNVSADSDDGIDAAVELESQYSCEF